MLKVENVTRCYGSFTAVNNVSFELKKGEIVGFLGPNGSGKTTLLRVMSTFLLPNKGKITVNDIDVVKEPLKARKIIGYMPESNILYVQMRVDKYLSFVGQAKGLEGDILKSRLEWCIDKCQLKSVLLKKCEECSRGYRQRIALAATLIGDPEMIMLDEPSAGLDPLQIFSLRDLIKSLLPKKTVIFSSHILDEVASITDRVLIINNGLLLGNVKLSPGKSKTAELENLFLKTITGDKK